MGISTSLVSQQVKQTDRRFYFNTENFFNYSELVSERAVLNEERTVTLSVQKCSWQSSVKYGLHGIVLNNSIACVSGVNEEWGREAKNVL